MTGVGFEHIEEDLRRLRDFVLEDLERIVAQEVGGNYAVATLVAIAYEELARLRHGRRGAGHEVFTETVPARWRAIGRSLYDALRNGLVHRYEVKLLMVGGEEVEVSISWRERRHLSVEGARLYLDAERLVADLRRAFEHYEAALRAEPELRDRFVEQWGRERVREVRTRAETDAWRELLERAPDADHPVTKR